MRYFILILLFLSSSAFALERESFYSDLWCTERDGLHLRGDVKLEDEFGATYPDCVLETEVVEVDWASKWYEGVGQAFHYARMTGKTPAVLLLMKSEDDRKHVERLKALRDSFQEGPAKIPFNVYVLEAWKLL